MRILYLFTTLLAVERHAQWGTLGDRSEVIYDVAPWRQNLTGEKPQFSILPDYSIIHTSPLRFDDMQLFFGIRLKIRIKLQTSSD